MAELPTLAFTAIGMMSSLGDANNGCAAARAGLSRPTELPLAVTLEDEIMPVALAGYQCFLAEGFQEYGRLSYLAYLAIVDLVKQYPKSAVQESSILVVIPASCERPSLDRQSASLGQSGKSLFSQFFTNLLATKSLKLDGRSLYIFEDGEAGIAKALASAQQILSLGKSRSCLIVSVDSFLDDVTLEAFVLANRIRTPDISQGFLPGEAATAFLLEPAKQAATPLAMLGSMAMDVEDYQFPLPFELFTEEPKLTNGSDEGEGDNADNSGEDDAGDDGHLDTPARVYAKVIESAVVQVATEGLCAFFKDLNGEVTKANEWGQMIIRLPTDLSFVRDQPWDMPALSFGHIGCATMGAAVCMAIRGGNRGYLKNHKVLICGGSDRGLRAALVLAL